MGENRYWRIVRLPVLISTVTVMPSVSAAALPSARIEAEANCTVIGNTRPTVPSAGPGVVGERGLVNRYNAITAHGNTHNASTAARFGSRSHVNQC